MRCRCSNISRCNQDISTLSQMIERLTQLEEGDSNINNRLNYLANVSVVSITPQNIGELTTSQQNLNSSVSSMRNQMLWNCIEEKSRLQNECNGMQSEDREYHRKQEEDKRNNR